MSWSDAGHQWAPAPIGAIVERLLSFAPRVRKTKPEDRFRKDLERIALSAPHLLMDIGFVRDPEASSPARTTWRKGPLRVAISSGDGSASVSEW